MPYDETLVKRIRKLIPSVALEKKMFGGVGFIVNGNMALCVYQEYLIVRVGLDQHKPALTKKGAKPFDITGKPMAGWVMISQEGCNTKRSLEKWISMAMEFVISLPAK